MLNHHNRMISRQDIYLNQLPLSIRVVREQITNTKISKHKRPRLSIVLQDNELKTWVNIYLNSEQWYDLKRYIELLDIEAEFKDDEE